MHTPSFSYTRQNWEAIPLELFEKDVLALEKEGGKDAPAFRRILEEARGKQNRSATLRDAGAAYVDGSEADIPCEMPGDGNLPSLRDAEGAFDENKSNLRDAERILSGDY
jgi:hypothetical protein